MGDCVLEIAEKREIDCSILARIGLEPCQVVPISERTFLYLVHETPYFALDVMRTLAGRVRRMNDKVLTL